MKLPVTHLNVELRRLHDEHLRTGGERLDLADADMVQAMTESGLHIRITWPDGPEWLVAVGPDADAVLEALEATKH